MNVRVVTINSLQMHACTGHRNRSSDLLKNGKNENSKMLLWCGLKGLVLRYSYSKLLIHLFCKLIGASFTMILIYLDCDFSQCDVDEERECSGR